MSKLDAALDASIKRLSGGAATPPPVAAATTEREDSAGAEPTPTPPLAVDMAALDVGWMVYKRGLDESSEIEHRPFGIVIDAAGPDCVVVARDKMRQRRQETWFETWSIDDLDPALSVDPGTSKKVQAAKKLCLSIGETIKSGRWSTEDEACLMAAARLTAAVSGGRAA